MEKENKIKETWRSHPLYMEGVVEMVPIEWVWKYRGQDVSFKADLMDGKIVDMDGLWKNLVADGLCEPLIMRVGVKNKKGRLEAGNHRIQVLRKHGLKYVPLTVEVRNECGPHLSDVRTIGSHNFDIKDELLIKDVKREYLRPSQVFLSLNRFLDQKD